MNGSNTADAPPTPQKARHVPDRPAPGRLSASPVAGRPHPIRLTTTSVVVTIVMSLLSGCTSDSTYVGVTNLPDIDVSDITLQRAERNGGSSPFTLTAASSTDVLVLFFGFTNCPDQCPTTLADLREARRLLGDRSERVDIAFVTVDLQRDTPEVLTQYLDRFEFGEHGHALRPASEAELARTTKAVFASSEVARDEDGHVQVGHTAWSYVINDTGKVVLEWEYGTSSSDMAHDLGLLLDNDGELVHDKA